MMAQDARVRYTRYIIQTAFVELLRETPLNKVTVKEICRRGEINRATFYRHFADPYDLMDRIEEELLEQLESYVEQSIEDGFQRTMGAMLKRVAENGEVYRTIVSANGDPWFSQRLSDLCWRKLSGRMDAGFPGLSAVQRKWLYEFSARGCSGVLQSWMSGGMTEPPEEVAAFMACLVEQTERSMRQLQIVEK